MVQPAPQPFGVVATASTSGWSGSGVNPAGSSTPTGAFPGPHYVEEQTLHINYVRVPRADTFMMPATLTLSSATATYMHANTILACIVTANYSRKKVDAIFDTSTYQQPQKFEFLSVSSDSQGSSYGEVNASCLGPAGDIVTSQPWYYRRPWDDTQDTEISKSIICSNFGCATKDVTTANGALTVSATSYDQSQNRSFPQFWIKPEDRYTFLANQYPYAYSNVSDYFLYGEYNTSQESLVQIINFIDNIAWEISSENMFHVPAHLRDPEDFPTNYLFKNNAGLPEYGGFRHDYS